MQTKQSEPLTLYVQDIETTSKQPRHHDTETPVDIELSNDLAQVLMIYLQHRLSETPTANIRVRLSGKLVI